MYGRDKDVHNCTWMEEWWKWYMNEGWMNQWMKESGENSEMTRRQSKGYEWKLIELKSDGRRRQSKGYLSGKNDGKSMNELKMTESVGENSEMTRQFRRNERKMNEWINDDGWRRR